MNTRRGCAVAVLVVELACTSKHAPDALPLPLVDATAPSAPQQEVGPPMLRPLTDASWLETVDLPNGHRALVSIPLGATEPRPLMVAAHGAGDRPEWACGGWRGVTDAFPFIVCPQGTRAGPAFYWPSTEVLAQVVAEAIHALRKRFGAYVAEGPMLYAGFSAGAIYGAGLVLKAADHYPVLMMSEGGYDQLTTPDFASTFAKGGGKRVMLGCSTGAHCRSKFGEAARLFTRAGVEVRINDAGSVGHNLNGEVVTSLRKDWPWLVQGFTGWEHFGRP